MPIVLYCALKLRAFLESQGLSHLWPLFYMNCLKIIRIHFLREDHRNFKRVWPDHFRFDPHASQTLRDKTDYSKNASQFRGSCSEILEESGIPYLCG
jgi:hypothetical protein